MSYLGLRNGLLSLCACELSERDWWSQGEFSVPSTMTDVFFETDALSDK